VRILLFVVGVVLVAIIATLYALENPGYVLIARAPWSVEMTLTTFVLLAIAAFFAVALVVFLIIRLLRIPRDVARWRVKRRTREARTALTRGLSRLMEGNWVEAEGQLLTGLRYGDAPLLNYLGAAIASQAHGNTEKRDEFLAAAHQAAPQQALAVGMTQAYLQHLAGQFEQCLATLNELRSSHPRHRPVLRLLAQVYTELRDWTGLVELIPDLRQQQVMEPKEIDALELQAHRELLTLSLPSGSAEVLARAWKAVPKGLQRHPQLVAMYARQLMKQAQSTEAEEVLRAAIEARWDERLVDLYGQLRGGDVGEQLVNVEAWLGAHPESATLLLAAARLALANGLKPKARGYFEQCLAQQGPVEAYRELGNLLEQLGETDKAREIYRRALEQQLEESRRTERPRLARPAPRLQALR
jgi:HemY protein